MADVIAPEPIVLAPIKKHKKPVKVYKRPKRRLGVPSKREQELVEEVLRQRTTEVTPREEKAIAQLFDRSVATTKKMIQAAREKFTDRAERYVDIHMEATELALARGDCETALDGAQWAMKEIAVEGVRVIDRATSEVHVPKVMIGVKLGGIDVTPEVAVAVEGTVVPHD